MAIAKINNIIHNITGCKDCPCCNAFDMAIGYECKLSDIEKTGEIKRSKVYNPITPKWCPLKKNDVILKLSKSNMTFKERTILGQKILAEQPLITYEIAKKASRST
jgi:hypothetical protein